MTDERTEPGPTGQPSPAAPPAFTDADVIAAAEAVVTDEEVARLKAKTPTLNRAMVVNARALVIANYLAKHGTDPGKASRALFGSAEFRERHPNVSMDAVTEAARQVRGSTPESLMALDAAHAAKPGRVSILDYQLAHGHDAADLHPDGMVKRK